VADITYIVILLKYHISFVIAAKRLSESQDFFMEKTWTDVAEKRKARKRHRTASSNCSQISTETEELPPPEGYDNSDIEYK
jgi:uncharacterized protein YifE (UPF0438 family)